jgi:hypothetical protein
MALVASSELFGRLRAAEVKGHSRVAEEPFQQPEIGF